MVHTKYFPRDKVQGYYKNASTTKPHPLKKDKLPYICVFKIQYLYYKEHFWNAIIFSVCLPLPLPKQWKTMLFACNFIYYLKRIFGTKLIYTITCTRIKALFWYSFQRSHAIKGPHAGFDHQYHTGVTCKEFKSFTSLKSHCVLTK